MGAGAKRERRRLIRGARALFLSFLIGSPALADEAPACAPDRVTFKGAAGVVTFSAEVADDEESRARGLMRRTDLPRDHGMLFVYPSARQVAFWMKDTPLPLDIIFINRRGGVCGVARDTTPFSLEHIPSGCAAQTVFEVNAGVADEVGVTVGAVARHPAILAPLWPCE